MDWDTRESPRVEIFLEEAAEFVRSSPEEELGKLVNLIKNSYEPILVYDGEVYLGAVSLQNTVFNSRLAYKSRADSNLVSGGPVRMDDTVNTAIRYMVNYGWLRVPVFEESGGMAGQLRARKILQVMAENETFLQVMVLKARYKNPILLEDDARVEDAYGMLKNKYDSRLFVISKDGDLVGMVGKSNLVKAFNKRVESKRFSLKNGDPNHNIYVGEKIDREDYPISKYINQRRLKLKAKTDDDKAEMIKRLVNSKYNSLTVTDQKGIPVGVLSLRDLLRAVLVKDPTGDLNLIIRGFDGVRKSDLFKINGMMADLTEFIEKADGIDQIEMSNNEAKSSEGKINVYELMLKVELSSGDSYLAHVDTRNLLKGAGQLMDDIREQIRRNGS